MAEIQARFHLAWPSFTLDVNLTLPGRGITALFGASGSGKTTLLRCLAGLERPREGFLRFHGDLWQDGEYCLPTYRRPIGYVFQEASLFPHLTVLENLRFGLRRNTQARPADLEAAITLLDLAPLLDRSSVHLSGGERQRVAIARALAVRPRLLLMDEPLAALDYARKQEILPYLERLHDSLEIPLLYVSHAPDEVARLADHIVMLQAGKVLAQGPLLETLAQLDTPIRLGEDRGVVLQAQVIEHDQQWHLMRLAFDGGSVWTRQHDLPVGRKVRVHILASDVSVATRPQIGSSIQNQLQGVVDAMVADSHPGVMLVRVKVGASALIARLTKRSAETLCMTVGQSVWLQVKSVALME
ncbi:molybdenum ABC transporter ATP-binding protein [Methylophilus sp.]|uniref:molybdenum ABC transporter ATP-binding protein n=1 Tax=Methylophilus sp. TaxID=29541 RepID=UPI000D435B0C|nr:molybdenum ABC transporter ATP-binding protein [Methylophilus sp.]PPD12507.1 MAG: molybdenum ABC transporter ATP-binding protein [Methylophilus sp.]